MGLFRKLTMLERQGVGELSIVELRIPFSVFSSKYPRCFFKPELAGARWWEIDLLSWTDEEREEFTNSPSPIAAMAFLRSRNKIVVN